MTPEVIDWLISNRTNLFWAIVGAMLGPVAPAILFRIRQSRSRFRDTWFSNYQGIDEEPGTWVTETVHVSTYFGRFRFKNKGNSRHYDYKAFATLFKEDYLLGTWTSRYPGGTNRGAFILTFVTDGEFLCGYWVGRDRRGANRYGRWVLSKKEAGLAEAKKTLGDMRMPNPHWASVGRFPPVQNSELRSAAK